MRVFFLTSMMIALCGALPAMAGDPGTYRQGEVFMATPAFADHVCELQCSGDAQCRSWNFIPSPRPGSAGVCELNANIGTQLRHPAAISGTAPGAVVRESNRLVSGGTRTTRVGQPAPAPQPRVIPASVRTPTVHRQSAPQEVQRRYYPQGQATPQPAPQPAAQQPQSPLTPRVYGETASQPQAAATAQPALAGAPQARQIPARYIPQPQPQMRAPLPQPTAPQHYRAPQQQYRAPVASQPQMQPAPQHAPAPIRQAIDPRTQAQIPQAMNAPQHMQAPQPQYNPYVSAEDALYGSLYDDVETRPQQKLPTYGEFQAAPTDRPVSVTQAVPTIPVEQSPMPLAGAPR